MSQLKFSQVVDVPVSTIKAIEKGQRTLSPYVLDNVAMEVGAAWRKRQEQWVCIVPPNDRPYDFSCYLEFREIMNKRPPNDSQEIAKLMAEHCKLFEMVPDQYWHRHAFRYQDFVEKFRSEIEEKAVEIEKMAEEMKANRKSIRRYASAKPV